MRIRNMIIAYAAAFLLQMTFANDIAVMGTGPDLILVLTIVLCYMYADCYPVIICSTAFAFLHDLLLSPYVGIYALAMLLTGIAVMFASRFFNRENPLPLAGVLAAGTLLCSLVQWIVYAVSPVEGSLMLMLKNLPVLIIYDLIIGLVAFFVVMKYRKRKKKSRYYL